MRSSSSRPFSMRRSEKKESDFGEGYQDAAGCVVEQRSADRALPPAGGKGGVLVVADHDQIGAGGFGHADDLLDRLAHRKLPGDVEAPLAQAADALVEHALGAFFFLLEQLLRHEAFGEEKTRRHARHGEQQRLGLQKAREGRAFEKRAAALVGAVVREEDFVVFHRRLPVRCYFTSSPTRSIVTRSAASVSAAQRL